MDIRVSLSLAEYRSLYQSNKIDSKILDRVITEHKGAASLGEWKEKVLSMKYSKAAPRIGTLRSNWKREYKLDMDSLVHPILFRIICSYLDQGISIWNFPVKEKSFISSIRELERNSFTSFFKN